MVRGRGPVVRLDRKAKARMIGAVIAAHRGGAVTGMRVLDIGCGNGDISEHFAESNSVTGVDIKDQRRPGTDFEFQLVSSAVLPFDDESFDVVISNHTLEHIPDQQTHLHEIHRVVARDGLIYLATPNRSSPLMEGHVGNTDVLKWRNMAPLFRQCSLRPTEVSVDLLADPYRFGAEVRYARWLPRPLLRLLRPLYPSHVFILERETA